MWLKYVRAFVNRKKHIPSQIIYVTNLDRKGVVCVIVIFILQIIHVLAAKLDLEQNHEIKDYGKDDDLQWEISLEAKTFGT